MLSTGIKKIFNKHHYGYYYDSNMINPVSLISNP